MAMSKADLDYREYNISTIYTALLPWIDNLTGNLGFAYSARSEGDGDEITSLELSAGISYTF